MFDFPVLLGDIGGTNVRFTILPGPAAPAIPLPRTRTTDHAGPVEALRSVFHPQKGPPPRSALIAVATRVATAIRAERDRGEDCPFNAARVACAGSAWAARTVLDRRMCRA